MVDWAQISTEIGPDQGRGGEIQRQKDGRLFANLVAKGTLHAHAHAHALILTHIHTNTHTQNTHVLSHTKKHTHTHTPTHTRSP